MEGGYKLGSELKDESTCRYTQAEWVMGVSWFGFIPPSGRRRVEDAEGATKTLLPPQPYSQLPDA